MTNEAKEYPSLLELFLVRRNCEGTSSLQAKRHSRALQAGGLLAFPTSAHSAESCTLLNGWPLG